jgi:hypothetical protein
MASSTWDRVDDYGAVIARTKEAGGSTIDRVRFAEPQDISAIISALPAGGCRCPHWGVVLSGRVTVGYPDGRAESFGPGDAYYMPAVHDSWQAEAGTEIVQFSPSDLLAETNAAIGAAMAAAQGAGGPATGS